MEESGDYLIVGLGNPGTQYARTRHNFGFMVVEALALKYDLKFKKGWRIEGSVTSGVIAEKKVHLLKPTTFMNLSGGAVRRALHHYKIGLENLIVILDDVYVKFGHMRLRPDGGAGGHNGLKNIDACLGTQKYARLRMGVGANGENTLNNARERALEEYVLAPFTLSESLELPQIVERGASVVEEWLKLGTNAASELAGNLSKLGNQ